MKKMIKKYDNLKEYFLLNIIIFVYNSSLNIKF